MLRVASGASAVAFRSMTLVLESSGGPEKVPGEGFPVAGSKNA